MNQILTGDWCVRVVIPALDEEKSIGAVLDALGQDSVASIHVGDNGSQDATAAIAREKGARVVHETRRGYGSACLAALADLRQLEPDPSGQIVVFLDADFSDDPAALLDLISPIVEQKADFVIGSRVLGNAEPGSLQPQQRWGNALATSLIAWLYGFQYSDLGPFRAIRRDRLEQLEMQDPDFGWTVEMQIKAARHRFRICEIPVVYRRRIGTSKISGTIIGSIRAGVKILQVIVSEAIFGARQTRSSTSACEMEKR
ncbi:MAG: glycosyltransferase family 2 protein [Planctomycetota bacterium]